MTLYYYYYYELPFRINDSIFATFPARLCWLVTRIWMSCKLRGHRLLCRF